MNLVFGIDGLKPPLTGIGVYSFNLCKEFIRCENINISALSRFKLLDQNQLELLLSELTAKDSDDSGLGASNRDKNNFLKSYVKDSDFIRYLYHKSAQYAANLNLQNMDSHTIYHTPNFIGYGGCQKKVITVHDLSHLEHPEMHPKSRVRFLNSWLEKSIEEASQVIVDTEFIKQQLLESRVLDRQSESKVSAIHLGVSDDYQPGKKDDDLARLNVFGLIENQYLLSVGTLEPRKNYETLVRAYLKLPKSLAAEYPLVLCGVKGWKYDSLIALINSVRPPYRVVLTGHISKSLMIALLRNSSVFVYPSIYEGFGLPILEAMKCGVPVITSDFGAMKEVAGDAAFLVDSYSADAIAEGLLAVLDSSKLKSMLISRGIVWSNGFTWQQCAKETLDVYERI